jgi:hypothetical protein
VTLRYVYTRWNLISSVCSEPATTYNRFLSLDRNSPSHSRRRSVSSTRNRVIVRWGRRRGDAGVPAWGLIRRPYQVGARREQHCEARLRPRRLQPVGAPQGVELRKEAACTTRERCDLAGRLRRLRTPPIREVAAEARGPRPPPGRNRSCHGELPPLGAAVLEIDGRRVVE